MWLAQPFPHALVIHLPFLLSDHAPLLIQIHQDNYFTYKTRLLRFEKWWLNHKEYEDIILQHWNPQNGRDLKSHPSNLAHLLSKLHKWGNSKIPNFDNKIKELLNLLKIAVEKSNKMEESKIRLELLQVLKDQESYRLQRSRVQLLMEGDKNTIFS